jgi:predicted alpha-1,2-mannosidase
VHAHLLLTIIFACSPLLALEGYDLTRYVNPFIGTGDGAPDYGLANAAGNTPPGAAFPFGMVLWSPDTTNLAGGYRYSHNVIRGFSLTHISGRGIPCYQDIPFLPVAGGVQASPGDRWPDYASPFDHKNEVAQPGYYSVQLDGGIGVELAVTRRTGFARFTFVRSDYGSILINAAGSAQGNRDSGTEIRLAGSRRITGSAVSGDCGGWFSYRVFFVAEFDRPFDTSGVWDGSTINDASRHVSGGRSGAYVGFDTSSNPVVQVKVGLSYVSTANAAANLSAESPGWDFDAVRGDAAAAWNTRLNTIRVAGGTEDERTVFYTALYHAFIHPSTFSDTDGTYIGFDNQVHQSQRRTQYHNFAGWDTYRSQIPLLALIAPETSDMMQSLVNDAMEDAGGGLPRWEHANTNSGGMLGDSQDAVIATAYALGARDFDTAAALAAMEKGASNIGATSAGVLVREGLPEYLTLGYVPTAVENSGSRTLEYATDDFCISAFAKALGDEEKAALYLKRAQSWRNLSYQGYLVPRNVDGSFEAQHEPWNGSQFAEGSVAQHTWMVPFNLRGLIDMMGGNRTAVERLDFYFSQLNGGPWSEFAFMGNEPSLKAPWVYTFAGAPWRTQAVLRRILLALFKNSPYGLPGNDDLGTLSAWAVFAAAGVYPHTPGVGGLIVASPLFPSVTIQLANGGVLLINASEAAADRPYVQSLKLNGQDYDSAWIPWQLVATGGTIDLTLADTPNLQWASDAAAAPPSFDVPSASR